MITALKAFTLYGQDYASGVVVTSEVWTRLPSHRQEQMTRNRYVESSDRPIKRRKVVAQAPVLTAATDPTPAKRPRGRPRKAVSHG